MVVAASHTIGSIILVVFGLFVLYALYTAVRLFVRLMRGDEQIESTSFGKQFFGGRRRDEME